MKISKVIAIAAIVLSIAASVSAAPSVSSGYDPTATLEGAVRYKSLASGGDKEIYLGKPDLGIAGNRVQADAKWVSSNDITFAFDGANTLSTNVVAGANKYALSYTLIPGCDWNYMQIMVSSRATSGSVSLEDVILNGTALGSFSGAGWNNWMVTGIDLSSGFTLTGKLVLTGTQPSSAELNKVEIGVGCVPEAPVPEPMSMALAGLGLSAVAGIRRKRA